MTKILGKCTLIFLDIEHDGKRGVSVDYTSDRKLDNLRESEATLAEVLFSRTLKDVLKKLGEPSYIVPMPAANVSPLKPVKP